MNRLSWDSTAPRRHTGKRTALQPRPEDAAVAAEAELIRAGLDRAQRITNF